MVWLIIRKPTVSSAQLAGEPEVPDRDVGLGAVGGDAAIEPPLFCASLMSSSVPTPGSIRKAILRFLGRLGGQLDQLLLRGLEHP